MFITVFSEKAERLDEIVLFHISQTEIIHDLDKIGSQFESFFPAVDCSVQVALLSISHPQSVIGLGIGGVDLYGFFKALEGF